MTAKQYQIFMAKKKRNKYNNTISYWEGTWKGQYKKLTFHSAGEMTRFCELRIMEKRGDIEHFDIQKKFELIPKQKDESALNFIVDFYYIERGQQVVEDFKSPPTRKKRTYINKRKQFKQKYPDIEFRESGI